MVEPNGGFIRVRDLTKRYGSVEAVRGISFDLRAGEIMGLLGPNGAGKTTTIECLLGLRRPDAGSFLIGELDAFARPAAAKKVIGAQLQASALQDKITVREALALIAAFHGSPASSVELLDQFGLRDQAGARFESLSGGQKQRLLLALAFVNRPRLLLLDEPTAGLDPTARRDLHRLITALRDSGRSVLLSTHYLEEAQQLCDRVAIIDAGRLVACDTPDNLVRQSKAQPRIRIRTTKPLDPVLLASLAGAVAARTSADETILHSADVGVTTTALVQALQQTNNSLLDLHVEHPSLDDVFLERTGKRWSFESGKESA